MIDPKDVTVSDEERVIFRDLAQAIFAAEKRVNDENFDPKSEEFKSLWEEERSSYGRIARVVMRRLSAQGYSISKS